MDKFDNNVNIHFWKNAGTYYATYFKFRVFVSIMKRSRNFLNSSLFPPCIRKNAENYYDLLNKKEAENQ